MPFRKVPGATSRVRPAGLFPAPAVPPAAVQAHIDGGARGNPGPSGYGVVVHDADGKLLAELSEFLGHNTNNFAEYSALLAALDYALQHGHRELKIFSDSELLVKQIKGEYKIKSPELRTLYDQARSLINKLSWFHIEHVRREQNSEADILANEAMDSGMRSAFPRGENRNPAANRARFESREYKGIVRGGVVELIDADLPDGTKVRVRTEK